MKLLSIGMTSFKIACFFKLQETMPSGPLISIVDYLRVNLK